MPDKNDLTVMITSFSYRSGVPVHSGEHGGGFVFDCRCVPNPGRLPEFKSSTGRDSDVIEFLKALPEADSFEKLATQLVEQAVEHYLMRGFTSLEVAYGCTGGQHRSVYFAERLAGLLKESYQVNVLLGHPSLEQLGLI